jgi:serine/threonine-protein kinase SRPK3
MSSLLKLARTLCRRTPLVPLQFLATGFEVVPESEILEEEQFQDALKAGQYYPVRIGDVYAQKYQILGKLGFGTTSTVWLARHLQ